MQVSVDAQEMQTQNFKTGKIPLVSLVSDQRKKTVASMPTLQFSALSSLFSDRENQSILIT